MYETHPDVLSSLHYLASLSDAEREILHLYVDQIGYMNKRLKSTNESEWRIAESLFHIIQRAPPLSQDAVVYRGILTRSDIVNLSVDEFTSVTMSRDVALQYHHSSDMPRGVSLAEDEDEPGCCIFRILLPKGTKTVCPVGPESDLWWQHELVLPPGGKFFLTSKETISDNRSKIEQLNVSYIPQAAQLLQGNAFVDPQPIASPEEQRAYLVKQCLHDQDPLEETVGFVDADSLQFDWDSMLQASRHCLRTRQMNADFVSNDVQVLNDALRVIVDLWVAFALERIKNYNLGSALRRKLKYLHLSIEYPESVYKYIIRR